MLRRNLAATQVAAAPRRRLLTERRAPAAAKGHTLKIDPSYYGQITGQETREAARRRRRCCERSVFIFYGDGARQPRSPPITPGK